jgi:hypothetical protein
MRYWGGINNVEMSKLVYYYTKNYCVKIVINESRKKHVGFFNGKFKTNIGSGGRWYVKNNKFTAMPVHYNALGVIYIV